MNCALFMCSLCFILCYSRLLCHTVHNKRRHTLNAQLDKERKMQQALLSIRGKFGKNAILRGMNLEAGATTRDRNEQIGGHKA